jgi:hypothetical protein
MWYDISRQTSERGLSLTLSFYSRTSKSQFMDRSIHFMETGPESGIIKQFLYLYKDENRMFGFKVKMTIIKWTQLSAAVYKLGFG